MIDLYAIWSSETKVNTTRVPSYNIYQTLKLLMIVTCTTSGPVRPRLIQHELLVVLEFDKYFN